MGKLYQKYIADFSCSASSCPDTCCAKWQICIDEETAKAYLADSGEVGNVAREFMRGKIYDAHLALKNKRCPYLTDNNLCRIIQLNGEKYLSKVCSMHPRFVHHLFEDSFEFLSLSCPQVCKMFLSSVKEGFVQYGNDNLQNPYLSQFYDYVCDIYEHFKQINIAEELKKVPELKDKISNLFAKMFGKMEYLEKETEIALKSLSFEDFINGYNEFCEEYSRAFFAELFKYFSLVLYNEKSPVLPVAFLFSMAVCALRAKIEFSQKAIYKFVKEIEHSERNIKSSIRIMRSYKAQIIFRNVFCFEDLYT